MENSRRRKKSMKPQKGKIHSNLLDTLMSYSKAKFIIDVSQSC